MTRRIRQTAKATAATLAVGTVLVVVVAVVVGVLTWEGGSAVDDTADKRHS